MRKIVVSLSSLFAIAAALVGTAPAAFAMRVVPPAGNSPVQVAPVVHHSAGLALWQVALIVVASVVVVAAAVLGRRLAMVWHRPASNPATS